MSDGRRDAEIAAALNALRHALVSATGPDETIDADALRDLVAGRLDEDEEAELLDRLALAPEVRARIESLRRSKTDRVLARQAMGAIDPLGSTAPPVYHLDGPHGGREGGGEPVFGPDDRVELIARPAAPVAMPPTLTVWVGRREGPLRPVARQRVQRDDSGVFRVLIPAREAFDAAGRFRLMMVLGDEEMPPQRAEETESMVQVLRAWAVYDPQR
ncbi:MAG: hypothetical protein R3F65_20830 [bacterium]